MGFLTGFRDEGVCGGQEGSGGLGGEGEDGIWVGGPLTGVEEQEFEDVPLSNLFSFPGFSAPPYRYPFPKAVVSPIPEPQFPSKIQVFKTQKW